MAKQMVAKFPGSCRECGNRFPKGERILWSKDKGARHLGCAERAGDKPTPKRTVQRRLPLGPSGPKGADRCADCGNPIGRGGAVEKEYGWVCEPCDKYGPHED